jgi:hypothetical protein
MVEGSIGHSFHPGFFKSIKGNSSRLEEYLKFWGLFYNSEYRKLFNIKRLSGCITAANRIKYCEKKSMAIKYLKEIASDSYFFELYKTEKKRLSFSRRIIACLLNYHYYNIIWLIIKYLTVYRV